MDPLVYLRALRRRWWLVPAALALALLAGFLTLPAQQDAALPTATQYRATHTLLKGSGVTEPVDLATLQLQITNGQINRIAAVELGEEPEQGAVIAAGLQIAADPEVGSLAITASDSDPQRAVAVADTFGQAVQDYLIATANQNTEAEVDALDQTLTSLSERLAALQTEVNAGAPGSARAQAELVALQQRYGTAFGQREDLLAADAAVSPLNTLQAAVAIPVLETGNPIPTSRTGRLALAALLGLLLGIGLALVLDRLDTRLRTREAVEQSTGLPVVAEVPALTRAQLKAQVVESLVEPDGAVAESHRALRSALLLVPARPLVPAEAEVRPIDLSTWSPPQVVLVSSPSAGDGKTSTVLNLAAALAESGRSVIVLDADLRKPMVGTYLRTGPGPGLADLLASEGSLRLEDVLRDGAPGLRVATSGNAAGHPAALLARLGEVVRQARALADVVLVDSAPLLAANDATDIVPHVDAVVLVTRWGRTTTAQADRAVELLSRLAVPVLGAVVVATPDSTTGKDPYYGQRNSAKALQESTATAEAASSTATGPVARPLNA